MVARIMRFFFFTLVSFLVAFGAYAKALTSITVDGRDYNLVVFSYEERAEPVNAFNDALSRESWPGRIDSCSFAIDMPVGVAKGNHSYGGFCSYREAGETKNVMICADIMVGHLKMRSMEKSHIRDGINELAKFVADGCFGG